MSENLAQVLVTGRLWLGAAGARSIGASLVEIVDNARSEIIIVAYRLTIAVPEFITAIEKALSRGCYVRIILDKQVIQNDTEIRYIDSLMRNFKTLTVWDFKEITDKNFNYALHAKAVIVDRTIAIVGSANFSKNGMVENHEMAIKLTGKTVQSLAISCDTLIKNGLKEGVIAKRIAHE